MDMIQKKNVLLFGLEEGMIRTTKEGDIMDDNYFVSITDSSSECRSFFCPIMFKNVFNVHTQKKSRFKKQRSADGGRNSD